MNAKLKPLFVLFAMLTLLTFVSCERDLYDEPIQQTHKKNKAESLRGAAALQIAKKLNRILKNNVTLDASTGRFLAPIGIISFDEVRKVTDTLGNVSYTFRLDHPESSDQKFFNIVLQEKNEHSTVKMYEYEMTPTFASQYRQTLSLINYAGTVKSLTLESDNPCPENDFVVIVGPVPNPNGGNGNGGNGGNGNGGNGGTGGTGGTTPIGGDPGGGPSTSTILFLVSIAAEAQEPDEWIEVSQSPRYFRLAVQNTIGIDPDEPCDNEMIIGILTPIDDCSKTFLDSLNGDNDLKAWFYDQQTRSTPLYAELINYVSRDGNNVCHEERNEFVKNFIRACVNNPSLNLDFQASLNSPAFVDLSSVSDNSPEAVKFREVYTELTQSAGFKNLFLDLFGTTPILNVKFKIEELSPMPPTNQIPDGVCSTYHIPNEIAPFNVIAIDKSTLLAKSKINLAIVIIHECIHAYLSVKKLMPEVGMTVSEVNDLDIQSCINTAYNGFVDPNDQHSFMNDFLVPVTTAILMDVYQDLATPTQINELENPTNGAAFLYAPEGTPPTMSANQIPWNWHTCFTHLSYTGLQNCTSYPFHYPFLNDADYYHLHYIYSFNAIFNP